MGKRTAQLPPLSSPPVPGAGMPPLLSPLAPCSEKLQDTRARAPQQRVALRKRTSAPHAPPTQDVKDLMKQAAFNPGFLHKPDGRKFIAACFGMDPSLVAALTAVIKNQVGVAS